MHKSLCWPWPEMETLYEIQQVRAITAPTRDNERTSRDDLHAMFTVAAAAGVQMSSISSLAVV